MIEPVLFQVDLLDLVRDLAVLIRVSVLAPELEVLPEISIDLLKKVSISIDKISKKYQ
jgi:hypothetical protein